MMNFALLVRGKKRKKEVDAGGKTEEAHEYTRTLLVEIIKKHIQNMHLLAPILHSSDC